MPAKITQLTELSNREDMSAQIPYMKKAFSRARQRTKAKTKSVQVEIGRCNERGHDFEYIDYIPDFNNECYKLQFRCEVCGIEASDKVNLTQAKDRLNQKYQLGLSTTQSRYWRKPEEESSLSRRRRQQMATSLPILLVIGGSAN
jgi:hypothetical protein